MSKIYRYGNEKGLWPSQEWRRAPADKMMSNGSTETCSTGRVSEEPLEH